MNRMQTVYERQLEEIIEMDKTRSFTGHEGLDEAILMAVRKELKIEKQRLDDLQNSHI